MIRPLTFLSLVAAAGAGLHLYSVKHEVAELEKTLRETVRHTEQARERTAVLRAEWALLNEPERLRAAATRNLPLEVMQTSQFVRASELERRLPPAVAFAGAPSLFAPIKGERAGEVAVASAPAETAPAPAAAAANAAPRTTTTPMAANASALAAAATGAVARLAQAVAPAAQAASRAPVQTAAASRPVPAAVEHAPVAERSVAERTTPARVTPSHQPQVAALRAAEPRATEARAEVSVAEASRPARRPVRPAETTRVAEREVDRGMNLAAPPQRAALLRTAMHLRNPAPPAAEMPVATGSLLGGIGRPTLAPPVPVASASAATLR
ncbi:cell division protein FtsL [Roseomonas chloroacetimidivorans]|jgi:hypothetical protein|uniref:cell division protein FtsL n=1 Tax=Roseomonas chloroacetimidivorans TaxID=1766656 RepID=UPI003C791EE4